jgi:polar amino acid transport system substrate-binding protein
MRTRLNFMGSPSISLLDRHRERREARGDPSSAKGGLPRSGTAFARNDATGMFSEKDRGSDFLKVRPDFAWRFSLSPLFVMGAITKILALSFLCFFLMILPPITAAHAQDVPMPRLFGGESRADKPDLENRRVLRFLTGTDYAPFQFMIDTNDVAGFNVDLARALCAELETTCTLQGWAADDLLNPLGAGRVDAVVASLKATPELLQQADVSRVYFRIPARFVLRREAAQPVLSPEQLTSKTIAAVGGSAHEAFLKAFFPDTKIQTFGTVGDAAQSVAKGQTDGVFADGVRLAAWLGSEAGKDCAFAGGPYYESHFFGEGMVIAVKKGDSQLLGALNYALGTLEARGVIADLYLRWFPIGIY